jgi:hypothetical protein
MRALIIAAALLVPGAAAAYPQFQLSTGAQRCNQCHFAPAGGGLISGYGRDEAGDTISAGGDGAFLHGAWEPPTWLQLGLDYRGAAIVNDVGNDDGAELAAFPMQFDLYQHFRFGKQFSLTLTEGLRASARYEFTGTLSWLASREHYFMWRPAQQGIYARLGRFYTPFGLRLVEHPVYVRRHLGFHTFEEMHGLSVGYVKNEWEGHLTLSVTPGFFPDHLRSVGSDDLAVTAYYEKRFADDAAVGGQARVAVAPEFTRVVVGAVGKWSLLDKKLLLMAEVDAVRKMLSDVETDDITQLATYLSATYWIARGLMAAVIWERWDRDFSVKDVAQDAFSIQAQWFFSAHFELLLLGRTQLYTFGEGGESGNLLMLQFHYYL